MSCGMTWEAAEHDMDIPRLEALGRYWQHSPPVHLSVARYLGYKPAPAAVEAPPDPEEQGRALMQMIQSGAV
jgi:hypothetical protein